MSTRRARSRNPISRIAIFGALAVAIAFGALAVETAATETRRGEPHHAVIVPRDAHPAVVVAGTKGSRGSAWLASLITACAFVALAGYVLGAVRRVGYRRNAGRFSVRLRAPPAQLVAL
jgi:hypothetical protein